MNADTLFSRSAIEIPVCYCGHRTNRHKIVWTKDTDTRKWEWEIKCTGCHGLCDVIEGVGYEVIKDGE